MSRVARFDTVDLRIPRSQRPSGTGAPDAGYSAAYLTLETDTGEHGTAFVSTDGSRTDVLVVAIDALAPFVLDRDVDQVAGDLGGFSRSLLHDSQLRWLGPEQGVLHIAMGVVINAVWDLAARRAGQPLWELLSAMSVDQIVDLVDFRYLTEAITPIDAADLLEEALPGRAARAEELRAQGYPACTAEPGWLGHPDETLVRLAEEAVAAGFEQITVEVGEDLANDRRRLRLLRDTVGPLIPIALNAGQRWDVSGGSEWIRELKEFDPCWIEEPTSPDDVLGHAAIRRNVTPIRIATGESVHNRIVFKQLLQANAVDVLRMDATRVAGINEMIAVLLLAAHYRVPVRPRPGGVGFPELALHLAMFDNIAVSGTLDGRMLEYTANPHGHLVEPALVRDGAYQVPRAPGCASRIHDEILSRFHRRPRWGAP
ncbi:mandelate racemase [Longispora fulva]|uniref:L-fuconate dehydratase n=1 Tax=Longispora fulva TaxID=619741 RepID=A0A8J7GB39_9ACTN|nr:enolase C-terminal domain-like protein [Longispora fulva]MBG6134126.1 L-fuconate dehydratase [Longispora fulva]GIG62499.1 mandelate racemase [Longispora fulva]